MFRAFLAVFLALILAPSITHAWPARVVQVADGDTITVEPSGGGDRIKVRLHGIDCPEKGQPGGEAARAYAVKLALYKLVEVEPTPQGKDRYGRVVAVVILPTGESLQAALLREGHAWIWPRYCRDCQEWEALQDTARQAGRGLWINPNPVPPWLWRKGER